MTSGSRVYRDFADKRATLESQTRQMSTNIHASEQRRQDIVVEQGKLWHRMASIHLDAKLELPPAILASMDQRGKRIDQKHQEADTVKETLSDLKRKLDVANRAVDAAKAGCASASAIISAKFEADPAVVALRATLAGIDASKAGLGEKLARSVAERDAKRAAYEADERFMYLRGLKFGTPAYWRAVPMLALWDRLLARATAFPEENANYERLLGNPEWVQQRIDALAPAETDARKRFDDVRAPYFDVLKPQQEDIAAKTAAAREIENSIHEQEAAISEINTYLSDAALAADSEIEGIIADFSAILSRTGYYDLKRLAASTKDTEDDAIVARLQTLDQELAALGRDIESGKAELFAAERKVKNFQQIESRMRSSGWNDSDHTFSGVDASVLADRLALDAFSASEILAQLQSAHRDPVVVVQTWGGSSGGSSSSGSSTVFTPSSSFGGDSTTYTQDNSVSSSNDTYTQDSAV